MIGSTTKPAFVWCVTLLAGMATWIASEALADSCYRFPDGHYLFTTVAVSTIDIPLPFNPNYSRGVRSSSTRDGCSPPGPA